MIYLQPFFSHIKISKIFRSMRSDNYTLLHKRGLKLIVFLTGALKK